MSATNYKSFSVHNHKKKGNKFATETQNCPDKKKVHLLSTKLFVAVCSTYQIESKIAINMWTNGAKLETVRGGVGIKTVT